MHTRFLLLPFAACAASVALSGSTIGYFQTNLVSDGAVPANVIDPDLKNPWGISFGPTTPFWVSDNGTGLSTLYAGDRAKLGLVVCQSPSPRSNAPNFSPQVRSRRPVPDPLRQRSRAHPGRNHRYDIDASGAER